MRAYSPGIISSDNREKEQKCRFPEGFSKGYEMFPKGFSDHLRHFHEVYGGGGDSDG